MSTESKQLSNANCLLQTPETPDARRESVVRAIRNIALFMVLRVRCAGFYLRRQVHHERRARAQARVIKLTAIICDALWIECRVGAGKNHQKHELCVEADCLRVWAAGGLSRPAINNLQSWRCEVAGCDTA